MADGLAKGHGGLEGNELLDRLAKDMASRGMSWWIDWQKTWHRGE